MRDRDAEIRAYCTKRDAVLRGNDIHQFIAFSADEGISFSNAEVAEIALRKMQTAVPTLPMGLRMAAKSWLKTNGYESWDDGDVSLA